VLLTIGQLYTRGCIISTTDGVVSVVNGCQGITDHSATMS